MAMMKCWNDTATAVAALVTEDSAAVRVVVAAAVAAAAAAAAAVAAAAAECMARYQRPMNQSSFACIYPHLPSFTFIYFIYLHSPSFTLIFFRLKTDPTAKKRACTLPLTPTPSAPHHPTSISTNFPFHQSQLISPFNPPLLPPSPPPPPPCSYMGFTSTEARASIDDRQVLS